MENLFFRNPLEDRQLKARVRPREEDQRDLRGAYFRDTTAIVHSSPFRRMKHKTQVFFAPKNDHVCTRIEHVMHVATIAATICRSLGLDPDLAWAIGLGHDLGHTPFGHLGEKILAKLKGLDGFRHEIYSLRVVDHLSNHGRGLNLSYAVRDGIINHCGEKFEQSIEPDLRIKDLSSIKTREYYPSTWEGAVVRMSDKIAYLGRDLEDAIRLRIVDEESIPQLGRDRLGTTNSQIIDTLVHNVIDVSMRSGRLGFSDEVYEAFLAMKEFNYQHIYASRELASYHSAFERVLTTLHTYLGDLFSRFEFDAEAYKDERNSLAVRFGEYAVDMRRFYEEFDGSLSDVVFDYIAGMTDDYAIDSVEEIMVPTEFQSQFNDRLLEDR
ncbi:MAG: deoxyguanosinetriphosphate triphosphohydrolase family protein [Spirochaetaceae bacterium]